MSNGPLKAPMYESFSFCISRTISIREAVKDHIWGGAYKIGCFSLFVYSSFTSPTKKSHLELLTVGFLSSQKANDVKTRH